MTRRMPHVAPTRGPFAVYAIELRRQKGAPFSVYVGSTALSPERRFARHLDGGMASSRYVRRFGVRLRPDLYDDLNPLRTRSEARRAERSLSARLERRGYRVFGSCDGCLL